MWRIIGNSSPGTSHTRDQIPCQDSIAFMRLQVGGHDAVAIAISDGAGSATLSHLGSKTAVDVFVSRIANLDRPPSEITTDIIRSWFDDVITELRCVAATENADLREFACTLLIAILTDSHSIFVQLGDGAWIVER